MSHPQTAKANIKRRGSIEAVTESEGVCRECLKEAVLGDGLCVDCFGEEADRMLQGRKGNYHRKSRAKKEGRKMTEEEVSGKIISHLMNNYPHRLTANEETAQLIALVKNAGYRRIVGEPPILTDGEISQVKADYANSKMDAGYRKEHFKAKNWGESAIAQAQRDADVKWMQSQA